MEPTNTTGREEGMTEAFLAIHETAVSKREARGYINMVVQTKVIRALLEEVRRQAKLIRDLQTALSVYEAPYDASEVD